MPEVATRAGAADGRAAGVRSAAVTGLGHHSPERVVPNAEIAERIGVDHEWIVRRTGVHSRRWAAEDETLADMAVAAGRRALADAGLEAAEVDLVLVATMTADQVCPNAAPVVANALGAVNAGAIDVGAACTGWLAGLRLAAGQVEAGRARHVLLIGADRLSSITDPDDVATAALFADGAGATVVGAAADGARGIGPILLQADGSLGDRITAGYGEDRNLRMDGHSTYQIAIREVTEITRAAVDAAGIALDDVDHFVYHQANGRIIRAVGQRLELPEEKVADYVAGLANTSAASIPLALAHLRADGRLASGDTVLVSAIGGGFTWGAGVLEWSAA